MEGTKQKVNKNLCIDFKKIYGTKYKNIKTNF